MAVISEMKRFRKFQPQGEDGFRSGLERAVAKALEDAGVKYSYETLVVRYTKPLKPSRYTPDFVLPNGIIVECKGYFTSADRKKHLLVKEQHPDLDVRFLFSNSRTKIGKKSSTTYGMWAEKHGFKYADKEIPASWLEEVSKKP